MREFIESFPKKMYTAPQSLLFPGAPIITSSKPSLFTSSTNERENPNSSPELPPNIETSASLSSMMEGIKLSPKKMYAAPVSLLFPGAPIITSPKPSLFTSPARDTYQPKRSFGVVPFIITSAFPAENSPVKPDSPKNM